MELIWEKGKQGRNDFSRKGNYDFILALNTIVCYINSLGIQSWEARTISTSQESVE